MSRKLPTRRKLLAILTMVVVIAGAGAATFAVSADLGNVDRTPESVTVQPGETVDVTVDITADSNTAGLNVTSEEVQSGAEFLNFTSVNSQEGSAAVDNENGTISVLYIGKPSSDTLTYTLNVAEDTPGGTYTVTGEAVDNESSSTGTTTITVDADTPTATPTDTETDTPTPTDTPDSPSSGFSADRNPESATVQQGGTVDVSLSLAAGDAPLNVTSEEVQSGAEFLNFTNVNSQEGSADVDNSNGTVSVLYINAPDSDTLSYTIQVADDTPTGTYSIGGTAVTDESKDTGATSITVEGDGDGDTGDGNTGDGDTGDGNTGDGDTGDGDGDQVTHQRAPGMQTVAPGESVSVTVDVAAGGPPLNVTSEEFRTGSEFLNFTGVNSAEGSADVDNENGTISVLYINAPSSDTLSYTVQVAEDTPLGTYNIDGSAVTNQTVSTGTTEIIVEEDDSAEDSQLSVDRTPESVTAQPGDTVDVSIGLTANGAPLNVTSEEIQTGLDVLEFTSVSSDEGSAAVDNENGTISVLYINQPSSDTLTYTVELADDVDPGTYSLGGNAVTNQDISTGTTTITVPEPDSGADDGAGDGGDGDAGDGGDGDAGDGGDGDAGDGGDSSAGGTGGGDAGGGGDGGGLIAPDEGFQPTEPEDVQRDADVDLESAEVSDRLVEVGDRVEVVAVFENDGDEPGEVQADLMSEGDLVSSRVISVGADSTRNVSFTIQATEAGDFTLSLNNDSLGGVRVLESETPTETPPPETPTPDDSDDDDSDDEPQDTESPTETETTESPGTATDGQPGFGIVAVILALGAVILAARRR